MIAIIDYDAGNLASVARAVSYLGHACTVTNDIAKIHNAQRIIFPGVGAAGSAMKSLRRTALDEALKAEFRTGKPILGICLGTQIIMGNSEENNTPCLGIVSGTTRAFPVDMATDGKNILKIPHMGWNRIQVKNAHPLLEGLHPENEFYFVHGFYPDPLDRSCIVATTDYGICFASIICFQNLFATQFHLEKSGKPGLIMLDNFCRWQPDG
jgi:glutamine amidotransferase